MFVNFSKIYFTNKTCCIYILNFSRRNFRKKCLIPDIDFFLFKKKEKQTFEELVPCFVFEYVKH